MVDDQDQKRNSEPMLSVHRSATPAEIFITGSETFIQAVARTVTKDRNHQNIIGLVNSKMCRLKMFAARDRDLIPMLSLYTTERGLSRRQALQSGIGIAVPEWEEGVKLSKEGRSDIAEINKLRAQRRQRGDDNDR